MLVLYTHIMKNVRSFLPMSISQCHLKFFYDYYFLNKRWENSRKQKTYVDFCFTSTELKTVMGNFSEVGNFLLGILCLSFSLRKIEELAHRARKAKVVAKKSLTPVIHLHHLHFNEVQFTAITIRESCIFCLTMVIKIVVTNSILF